MYLLLSMGERNFSLEPPALPCIFLGYPLGKKGYKLYNLHTHAFFVSRDVVLEHLFPFINKSSSYFPSFDDVSHMFNDLPSSSPSDPSPSPNTSSSDHHSPTSFPYAVDPLPVPHTCPSFSSSIPHFVVLFIMLFIPLIFMIMYTIMLILSLLLVSIQSSPFL